MRTVRNTLRLSVEEYQAPGINANAVGPVHKYVDEITGDIVVELDEEELPVVQEYMDERFYVEFATWVDENVKYIKHELDGILSYQWGRKLEGNILTIWVEDFECDPCYVGPDPDPCEPDDDFQVFG